MSSFIEAREWQWTYPHSSTAANSPLTFTIDSGQIVLIVGSSGSGKSTLLSALTGLLNPHDEGIESGSLLIDGHHPTRMRGRVGLVMQDPDSQVVLETIGDEVAFGCENLGIPPSSIWTKVRSSLEAVGLNYDLSHSTRKLSGGEKQRLAIACALAMNDDQPGVLCFDEPTANLDPAGAIEVRDAIIDSARRYHRTAIIVEHRLDLWHDVVDQLIAIDRDGIVAAGRVDEVIAQHSSSLLKAGVWVPGYQPDCPPLIGKESSTSLLSCHDLSIGFHPSRLLARDIDLSFFPESTAITGSNGTGKTTLALTLSGLLPQISGDIRFHSPPPRQRSWWPYPRFIPEDPHGWKAKDLLGRIGMVFQQPEHQFISSTVRDELAISYRALQEDSAHIHDKVESTLVDLHLEHVADLHPFNLSGGQKRRLSVATILAAKPSVVILDEPTFGQDRITWMGMAQMISHLVDHSTCVIAITHDQHYVNFLAQRIISMDEITVGNHES